MKTRREICPEAKFNLATTNAVRLIAKRLQYLFPASFAHSARQWLAGVCVLLVLLAGGLAAHPAWHEALHDHGDHAASGADRHQDDEAPMHGDEVTCAVCAFAHQQVDSGWIGPVTAPLPVRLEREARPASAERVVERVWPEPSGRGPPAGV